MVRQLPGCFIADVHGPLGQPARRVGVEPPCAAMSDVVGRPVNECSWGLTCNQTASIVSGVVD